MFWRNRAMFAWGIQRAWSGLRGSISSAVTPLPAQLGLIGLGYIVALSALPPFVQLVAALGCFVAASRVRYSTRTARLAAQWLILPALLGSSLLLPQTLRNLENGLTATLTTSPPAYGSDAMYYNHYNALLVLRGDNPYVGDHLADAIHYFHVAAYTPIARGRFSDLRRYPRGPAWSAPIDEYLFHPQQAPAEVDPGTTHSYPAGAFLVDVPFVWAGLPSIAFPQVLLLLLLGIALIAAAPPGSRVGVAMLVFAARGAAAQVAGEDFAIWSLALVIGSWLLGDRRILSSLLFGAACAIKQTVWFVVPFYLVWTWRTCGGREAARRGRLAAGVARQSLGAGEPAALS
jgi:hypothetical protein